MESVVFSQGQRHNHQIPARKCITSGSSKDLWLVVREGSVVEVDSALALLKKNGGNINLRNAFGLTPLHIATWRNHIPIVKRLLAAGADPNARDGESGWTSLHRALHFGHLAVASALLQSDASITVEDSKSRTPIDLLSGPVRNPTGNEENSVVTELCSWGSGVNYQLGTGNAHIQKLPCKIDSLHGSYIKLISAAKFHSVAVSAKGEVYTWGYGRGGRLGHPDFDIHSGQAAVITPRQVTYGLGARRVKAIAAAKHHTVAATEAGEVFTWGSNREGQLGYTSVDTQATPRRVSSLKSKIVAVAAANKHTAVVSESGEVFTWGCNKEGQLGYGTSNSGSNYTPRVVDYLKGKVFVAVAAAKYHTVVLGADGEVFTWGHRLVTPRRVVIARTLKKSGVTPLKFHRKERLHVIAIAAGMVHSMALADDGALFYWISSDPDLRCQQLYSLCGKSLVSISAGKYWTAGVTSVGDVYMWDAKKWKNEPPVVTRLHGVKRATAVAVGETHLLTISSLHHPSYQHQTLDIPQKVDLENRDELELDEDFVFNDIERTISTAHMDQTEDRLPPSLFSLCEKVAAEHLVEPRSALPLLEIADSLEACNLRKHCEDIVLQNLDYIFTVSLHAISNASLDVLANLEKSLDLKSSESWSHRRLPTPTATFPVVVNSEEEESENEYNRIRDKHREPTINKELSKKFDSFLHPHDDANQEVCKQVRALRKKLQQIEMLEEKQAKGHLLDNQQIAKLQSRSVLERSLAELGVPIEMIQSRPSSPAPDGKGNKKVEVSRKQRKKSKQKPAQEEEVSANCGIDAEPNLVKGFLIAEVSEVEHKGNDSKSNGNPVNHDVISELPDINKNEVTTNKRSMGKKKSKKGGLSMFLSGALDDVPAPPPPPPPPKIEGPAWGGATIVKGSASLRDILDEQGKTMGNKSSLAKDMLEYKDIPKVTSSAKPKLSLFLPSKPIPMVKAQASPVPDGDKSTPPWVSSGTSPSGSRPSLRGIQMQQGKKQSLSHSPKTKTAGFAVATASGSPSDSSGLNRWYKPETETPSSIRSIQIEEKAIKDLKRFYTSVKIVKHQT